MSRFRDRALRRAVGQAIHRYDMIADGDRIAVGLSGGKDSLTLMWALHERLSRIPIHYSLYAIHIDPGFEGSPSGLIEAYCRQEGYGLRIEYADYGIRAHSEENRENPCFLCARLRRQRLFEVAHELGCNKLALGHNMDDIIETLFLNMCYAGEISTMVPCQSFFDGKLVVIRPLAHVHEEAIRQFAKDHSFPDFADRCPSARTSKRLEIKGMLSRLYRKNEKIKGNIFRSMSHVRLDYLLASGARRQPTEQGLPTGA
jgi:tRNA 2-thiocytidine biosynthesis protein TtcA